MAMHLKEGKPKTVTELGEIAENYIEAHAMHIIFGYDLRLPKVRSLQSDMRHCTNCGRARHLRHQCLRSVLVDKPSLPPKTPRVPYQPQREQTQLSQPHIIVPRCFLCYKVGHLARNCMMKQTAATELHQQKEDPNEYHGEAAVCQPRKVSLTPNTRERPLCRRHKKTGCWECFNLPAVIHHCQALVAICQDCGQQHPAIADTCQSADKCHQGASHRGNH